jgi:tetratricopeptide (TPR) repeat protein
LAVLALSLCLGSSGQSQDLDITVKGELHSDTPAIYSEYLVELVDVLHRAPLCRVDVHPDGTFEFRRIQPGEYLISVTDTDGRVIHEEPLSAHPHMPPLAVLLRAGKTGGALGGTVSVKQLLHPPSKKAFRSFVDAQRLSEAGDYAKAAATLERALRDSPGYSDAHTNLGAQYIRMGRYAEGLAELQRALEISGGNPTLYCNMSAAQLGLRRMDQAGESARAALRIDADFPQAHLMLGAVLANDPASKVEAMVHLRRAAGSFPSARRILEDLNGK